MTARAATVARPAQRQETPRPDLRQVTAPRHPHAPAPSWWARLRRRLTPVTVAVVLVVAALIAVVVGNMQLAAGQLRLQQLQSELIAVQSAYASTSQQVALLEGPATVAGGARSHHLVPPSEILQIPAVSLDHPLPSPTFSSAPCCSLTPGR